jgi:hypothetical protein
MFLRENGIKLLPYLDDFMFLRVGFVVLPPDGPAGGERLRPGGVAD